MKKWIVDISLAFVKLTGLIPALLFFKPRVRCAGKAARKLPSPCILVSNHRSLLDFVLYLLVFPFRSIRFLMAEVLFNKNKFFSTFLYCLGGIRVDRDARTFDFVSQAIEVLDQGGTLGIFPEGRLPVGGKPFPFTVSTAFIATHATAPIVPVYTDGNYGLFKRAGVVIGEPFYLTDYCVEGLSDQEQLEKLTQLLRQKVYGLKEEWNKNGSNKEKESETV